MTSPESCPASSVASRGVVHVAYGQRYLDEAESSARSVRATNPGLKLALITNRPPETTGVWDEVLIVPENEAGGSSVKLEMHRAPWERCLFLDTDTIVAASLDPVFALLDRFDFAGVQHSGGHHYELPGLPVSFPEFNSGVLAWRRNERVAAFFARWRELYRQFHDPTSRTWDQKSLRLALYESDLRLAALPHGYNLMPYFPSIVEKKVVVLHGRHPDNLRRLHRRMGRTEELRAYVPPIGAILNPQDMTWAETLRIVLRLLALKLRRPFGTGQ